jgi:NADPH2:quinone reductase
MKALLSKVAGGPETLVLDDIPPPKATPGFVLVQVKAVGVNYPDVLLIEDRYQDKPKRPFAPGGEVAGIVLAAPEGMEHLKPGDRVLGIGTSGGMAQQMLVAIDRIARIPDSMPFDEAAAFLYTYGTAWYALKSRGRLEAGESLLVLGAAGGVGLAAVELGKALGARVIAAASTEQKVALALSRGADAGVVYPRGAIDREEGRALAARFRQANLSKGVDLVFDPIGGDYAEPAMRALADRGRYLVVGFASGVPRVPFTLPLLKECEVIGVLWGSGIARDPAGYRRQVQALLQLHAAGKIRPHISERFPLARGGEAIAHLANRKAMGKVIVLVN